MASNFAFQVSGFAFQGNGQFAFQGGAAVAPPSGGAVASGSGEYLYARRRQRAKKEPRKLDAPLSPPPNTRVTRIYEPSAPRGPAFARPQVIAPLELPGKLEEAYAPISAEEFDRLAKNVAAVEAKAAAEKAAKAAEEAAERERQDDLAIEMLLLSL